MKTPLMPWSERRALIMRPFPITYYPPVKRWGGVQILNDEEWMRETSERNVFSDAERTEARHAFERTPRY